MEEITVNEEPTRTEFPRYIDIGLFIVAVAAVVAAILHSIYPEQVDETTAMFLAVAVVTLLSRQITKFKGFGIEVEKEVEKLKADVKQVEKNFVGLEKDLGPGSKLAVAPIPAAVTPQLKSASSAPPIKPDDPNKGQFGGAAERNGRKLSATITPLAGPKSSRCRVTIQVSSTDDSKQPLTGKVKFYLHPTFGRLASYDVDVKGGIAEDTISSYGAFTIGVEADGGATRLELDLVDVPGGTRAFYLS